jgi:iron(III) transport system ATP-binding protein
MLVVSSLTKAYIARGSERVHAVDDVSFAVREGEFFSILGPSGCGKTTVLRAIAGLEQPEIGEITIGGKTVFSSRERVNVPPQRRDVALMFQSYAIWPHMTVYENVAFPLRARRADRIDQRVSQMLGTVMLSETANRPASRLSGGQQQRLALARALVANPRLLLLDEPLSNLDVKLREQLRIELKRIQREYGVTTIYVTHDQAEALSLSDRLAVMEKGRLVQVGTPRQIYVSPATRTVAEFIGQLNAIRGTAIGRNGNEKLFRFSTPLGTLAVDTPFTGDPGTEVVLWVRPESVRIRRSDQPMSNAFTGKVGLVMYYGDHEDLQVEAGDMLLLARAPGSAEVNVGDEFQAYIDPRHITVSGD